MDELSTRLEEIARSPVLLVACDFDGTIAPIVPDPEAAEANREGLAALDGLSRMPRTHAAILSGRALGDLMLRIGEAGPIHLIGSHGNEFETGLMISLSEKALGLRQRLSTELRTIAAQHPGCRLEEKPASVALHYRNAEAEVASAAVLAVMKGPATWPGVHTRHGKRVIELSVVEAHKGMALQRLRRQLGVATVLFIGDDVTDEDAFATLTESDLGIKVGEGRSLARHRVAGPADVARILKRVMERRGAWLQCLAPGGGVS